MPGYKPVGALAVAFAGVLIFFAQTPAIAGCNSGNVASDDLLSSGFCQATATGGNAVAIGFGSDALGAFSTAIAGGHVNAPATDGVAIGASSLAGNSGAIAIGGAANAQGIDTTAIGHNAFMQPASNSSTIIGANSFANGTNNTALGTFATAGTIAVPASNATAIGQFSLAAADHSTALGQGATAGFINSTAIGSTATTTRANQVAVGTATNTYTLAGVASAASLAAQTGPVSFVTSDGAGNLATTTFNPVSIAALDGRVTNLENSVQNLNFQVRKAFEGTAVAIALGGSALPDNKRFAISANWGNFNGENAFGGVAQMRISNNLVANAALGAGFARGGVGGRVGGTVAW